MCSERAIQGTRYCLGATTKSEGTGFSFGGEYERRLSDLLGVVVGVYISNNQLGIPPITSTAEAEWGSCHRCIA